MRIPRIYTDTPLSVGTRLSLDAAAHTHIARVLRLKPGAPLVLFNGTGGEYAAILDEVSKRHAVAHLTNFHAHECESPLPLWLAQGISRGERMDYTVQKAVELGIKRILPLFTDRCGVQLSGERLEKRLQHWQAVAVSACEQCGRNRLPEITAPRTLTELLRDETSPVRLVLDPQANTTLRDLPAPSGPALLLIGPEGGLSNTEIAAARAAGFLGLRLGPRILRTETAAVAALAALQTLWGDYAR